MSLTIDQATHLLEVWERRGLNDEVLVATRYECGGQSAEAQNAYEELTKLRVAYIEALVDLTLTAETHHDAEVCHNTLDCSCDDSY